MKIVKLFGVVVAVHAALFMFVFAIPGCRSTGKTKAAAPASTGAAEQNPLSSAPATAGDGNSPVGATDPASPVASVRFSPTRPGPAADAITTAQSAGVPAETQPAASYTVVKGDNLWTIAKKNNVTVKALTAANNLRTDSTLKLGQKLIVPGKVTTPAASSVPAAPATTTHTVKAGETLATVARHAGTTPAALKTLNKLKSDKLSAGQVLTLPAGSAAPAAATAPESSGRATTASTHVIKSGETLGTIAHQYHVKAADLATLNNIADPTKIRVGQELKIPGSAKGAPAAATTAPAASAATAPVKPAPAAQSPIFSSPLAPAPAADSSPFISPAPETQSGPIINAEDGSAPKAQ